MKQNREDVIRMFRCVMCEIRARIESTESLKKRDLIKETKH